MVVQAWSFLISRNQSLDYRTIVAPDFMTEINLSGKLSMIIVDEEQTEDGYVHYSEIHSAKFGDLSLIYHTFKSNEKDIGLDSDSILTDRGGREISSVEGIVLRGRTPNILITNHTFKEIHQSLMFNYKDFWNVSEFTCPYSSVPFELGFNHPNETSLQFIHHNPYILDTPKNSLCAKWILLKRMRPFNDSKLISATFSPNDNKVALYLIKNGMSLTPCVIYLNLSAPFTHLNAMIIFEGDRGLKAFENFYLNGLSPAIFSPNGQFIAFSAIQSPKGIDFDHNVIKFYEVQQGQIKTIDVNGKSELGRVLTIAFTPDSQIIASAGTEERIRFWNVLTREEILQTFDSSVKGRVQAISFSPNGKFLVSGSSRGVIRLWNWQEKRLLISLKANDNVSFVESLAFSPDSQKLVVGESSGAIKIYDINDQGIYQAYDILASKWGGICSINFSSHREIFASGSSDGEVKIWDTEKGELLHTLWDESKVGVRSVAFNPNGDTLIAAMEQDEVYVWHREEETE